jgi:TPR repeat protein
MTHPNGAEIAALRERADGGDGEAALRLGRIYEDGLGVPRDDRRAAAWYQRGAALGNRLAMCCLAGALFDGRGVEPSPEAAVAWLLDATEDGGPNGCHRLAMMMMRGEGVEPEPEIARSLFTVAAMAGHLPSLFTTIEEEALRYRRAATGPGGRRSTVEAPASGPASLPGAADLDAGLLVWNGDAGLPCDDALAVELFRSAARQGNALAAACLSHALNKTDGDGDESQAWLEVAARAGLAGAERHLALGLLVTGQAGFGDPRVRALLESAAGKGDAQACSLLATALEGADATDPSGDPDRKVRIAALRLLAARNGGPVGDSEA